MKHILSLFVAVAAFAIAAPARANDPAPGAGAGAQAPAPEGTTGNQTTPSPPPPPPAPTPAAKKEESDDQKPGFVKRVLMAATGNKTAAATLTEKDTRIAALEAEVVDLKSQVQAKDADLLEATQWITGVANGTVDPVAKPAPNPTAAAAATAVQTQVSNTIRKTGVPTQDLQPVERVKGTSTVPAEPGSIASQEAARLQRLDAIWKDAGYDRQALAN